MRKREGVGFTILVGKAAFDAVGGERERSEIELGGGVIGEKKIQILLESLEF